MTSAAHPRADALILFGISGDLARKKLFPALYQLTATGVLDVPVVGVGRTDWDDETLRSHARLALEEDGQPIDDEVFSKLAANLCYVAGDYADQATYPAIAARLGDARCTVSYLAIPPALFDDVVEGLAAAGLNRHGRVVLEKPFARDTASAIELNEIIHRHYPEDRVYRIDHFLGKEAVQNLMIFRFSNTVLEPVWNRHFVRGVQITLAEDFAIEGRGSFYDGVGAIRDVIQNHLFQVLALLAMEPPVSEDPGALRDERVKVLRAVESLTTDDVVRGRYDGYLDEAGVAEDSTTETFAAVRLEIDSWRWAGVPWLIRAGKAMAATVTEAVVEFDRPPRPLFAGSGRRPGPNRLTFKTKPEEDITLSMQSKIPGPDMVSGPVELHMQHDRHPGSDAYGRLLGDALRGDPALFARQDGVMEAWRVVEGALDDPTPPVTYEPGSWGPDEADRILGDWEWVTP